MVIALVFIFLLPTPLAAHPLGIICVRNNLDTRCGGYVFCVGEGWDSLETQRDDCSWKYQCFGGNRGFNRAIRRWRKERGWSRREYRRLLKDPGG